MASSFGKKRGRQQIPGVFKEDDKGNEVGDQVVTRQSRRMKERSDSVTETMLQERRAHLSRIAKIEPKDDVLKKIKSLGLGQRQKAKDVLRYRQSSKDPSSAMGATGFATYLAASSGKDWPRFRHMLPEVAFAGHSNCGKSSLINAISGMAPKRGVARVSDRAGWTDAIFFYQLGKKPPLLNMADLPGYGHAVATKQQMRRWREMTHDYLTNREILSMCCVLVDCVRGLCREDKDLLRLLKAKHIPTKVVLTKGDLLTEDDLARSHAVVREDMMSMGLGTYHPPKSGEEKVLDGSEGELPDVVMVSASSGAGVTALWKDLLAFTRKDVVEKAGISLHHAAIK